MVHPRKYSVILTNEYVIYNIHQDTKSARLIAVCKRSVKMVIKSVYQFEKLKTWVWKTKKNLQSSLFGNSNLKWQFLTNRRMFKTMHGCGFWLKFDFFTFITFISHFRIEEATGAKCLKLKWLQNKSYHNKENISASHCHLSRSSSMFSASHCHLSRGSSMVSASHCHLSRGSSIVSESHCHLSRSSSMVTG